MKYYQWFEIEQLMKQYANDPVVLELLESHKELQRKNKFYEYYYVHDDTLDKMLEAASDALDNEAPSNVLWNHLSDILQDVNEIRKDRDLFKSLYLEELFENKRKSNKE